MLLHNIIKTYPFLHKKKEIIAIEGAEVFTTAPKIRLCDDVEIDIDYPFSRVKFNKDSTILAFGLTILKIDGGYSFIEDFELFLNNKKIPNYSFDELELMISENIDKLLPQNYILIKKNNTRNWEYFKHVLVFPKITEEDETFLIKEFNR